MTRKFQIIAILSALHTANDGTVVLLPTLLPAAVLIFGMSYVQLGILVSAGYLANVVVQPLAGQYSERIEPKKLLALGIGVMGASTVVIAYAPNYSLLLVGAVLLRLGSSFYHPIANSVVSRTTVRKSVDRRMGVQSGFGDLGSLLIFSGGAVLYSVYGWKLPFLIFAGIDLVFSLFVYTSLENVNSKPRNDVSSELEKTKNRVASANTAVASIVAEVSSLKNGELPYKLPVSFFFVASFISAGAYAIILNFANSLLSHEYNSIITADGLLSLWLAAFVLGDFLCGELSRKVDRTRLIMTSYAISGLLYVAFPVFSSDQLISAVVLAGNGFALSLTFPLVYAELGSRSILNFRKASLSTGTMFGLLFTSQVLGSATLAFAAGELSSHFGLSFPFIMSGGMLLTLTTAGAIVLVSS